MKGIFTWLADLFNVEQKKNKNETATIQTTIKIAKPKYKELKDVVPGERVKVEWHRISKSSNYMGILECINNIPEENKMLLQVKWSEYEKYNCDQYEQVVFKYDSIELRNFKLLNNHLTNDPPKEEKLLEIKKQMKAAMQSDDFGRVDDLQRELDSIRSVGTKAPQ